MIATCKIVTLMVVWGLVVFTVYLTAYLNLKDFNKMPRWNTGVGITGLILVILFLFFTPNT